MNPQWVVIADSPFLPANGGGEREHVGFLTAAGELNRLALVVIPTPEPLDLAPYVDLLGDVPVLQTPRRTAWHLLASPVRPYVVASRPAPDWLLSAVVDQAPDATGIVVFSYKSWLIGERLATATGLPTVMRQHNLEGDYHRSLARGMTGLRRAVMHIEATRITRDERRVEKAKWLTATADISASDAAFRQSRGTVASHVPPFAFGASLANLDRDQVEADRVLFLGALDVVTNTVALDWFLENVWPQVRASRPGVVLDVVGRRPGPGLTERLSGLPSVELHADVPSVDPFLERAAVAVNPAVSGSGVNIKLIDYLQAGLPVVSTSLATRGLALEPGRDLEVHDRAEDFAGAVAGLLADPVRARRLAQSGRSRIADVLDPEKNIGRMADLLGESTAQGSVAVPVEAAVGGARLDHRAR